MGVILCGLTTPAAADFCGQNYSDGCEWSILDGKMTLGADWLYWKVQQDGIHPGVISTTDTAVVPAFDTTRSVHPKFQYESGYRVNLGYELPCDCWDVNICYTYMPSHAKTNKFAAASAAETFVPASGTDDEAYSFFTSKWNLNLNNVDLDIGRTVSFGECLKVRPHVGFRTTWFDQKFRSLSSIMLLDTTASFVAASTKEKFQGYGVEAGLWSDYKLGYGISLVGHFGGSILYSKFKVRSFGSEGVIAADGVVTETLLTTGTDCLYSATPSVDYFVGLQYADNFCDMLVRAHIGWEQHVMFDTNRYMTTGNLSGQGLTLGLEVGF